MTTAEELRKIASEIRRTPRPIADLIPVLQRAADELDLLGGVVGVVERSVTVRNDDARARAIAAVKLVRELLEEHPDRIEGLLINETPCNDGVTGFVITGRVRP